MQLEYCQRILLAVDVFCFGAAVAVARRRGGHVTSANIQLSIYDIR